MVRVNCFSISEDATLVAGGFSESFIKVWSLKGEKLKSQQEIEEGNRCFLFEIRQ